MAKKKQTKKEEKAGKPSNKGKKDKDEVPLKEAAKYFKKHDNYFELASDLEPELEQKEESEEDDADESEDMYE